MNYKNKAWYKLRQYVLARDKYLCQYYLQFGKAVPAQMVHHIYPVDQYPELKYNPDNLISLSNKAHNMMHDRYTKEITAEGKKLQRKVRNKIFGV